MNKPKAASRYHALDGARAFAMLLGVIIGTYSSIFIAAPLLGYLGVKRDWSDLAAKAVAATKSKAKA